MSEAPERIYLDGDVEAGDGMFPRCFEDPKYASEPQVEYVRADRIEELEAQITELHYGVTAAHFQGYIQGGQAAEAKLAKAIKTLEYYAGYWADDKTFIRTDDGGELASETIKELTGGQKDD